MTTINNLSSIITAPEDPSSWVTQMQELINRNGIKSDNQTEILALNRQLYDVIESDFGQYSVAASDFANQLYFLKPYDVEGKPESSKVAHLDAARTMFFQHKNTTFDNIRFVYQMIKEYAQNQDHSLIKAFLKDEYAQMIKEQLNELQKSLNKLIEVAEEISITIASIKNSLEI